MELIMKPAYVFPATVSQGTKISNFLTMYKASRDCIRKALSCSGIA